MEVYQLVHTLSYGDAISGEALSIKRILQSQGITSEIYCVNVHPKLKNSAKKWGSFEAEVAARAADEDILLILHYSLGSPLNRAYREFKGRRGIIYHNLTPAHWFENYNSRVTEDLISGAKELPELVACSDVVLADSTYNASEISEYSNPHVLPLTLDTKKWNISANPGIASVLKGHGGKNFLHVGRIAPNKCIEDIIKAFYFYHHKIDEESRLWLIGGDIDTEIYSFELRRIVSEFHLKEAVTFVGTVSDEELRAFYENCDAYLCMSEHEGFCVPLVEAMHFGLPVIAYDACAVAETLGDGGILLQQKAPEKVAELMHLLVTDSKIRGELISRGRKRVSAFSEDKFEQRLKQLLLEPQASPTSLQTGTDA